MYQTLIALSALLVVGCGGDKVDVPVDDSGKTEPIDCSTVTDTFPQFCGSVPQNLIFVSIDTFRRDHMARYGGKDIIPFLDRMADEGLALDNHVQCSDWTFASTTCTLQGAYNVDADFLPSLTFAEAVPTGHEFVPRWLRDEHEMWSVLVSSNAWLSQIWGNGRDYDVVVYPGGARIGGVGENAVQQLQRAQEQGRAERWFMHLHALEPHAPYNPPEEYLTGLDALEPIPWSLETQEDHYGATGQYGLLTAEEQALLEAHLRVRYEGEIALMNDGFETVFAQLDLLGLLDDTLVVFWTDHGEQFWEHGKQTHAHELYGEENDAIAIFWSKNMVPATWDGPTSAIDIVPTVLTLMDVPIPPTVTGTPVGQAPEDRSRFAFVKARDGEIASVINQGWKLQFKWNGDLALTNPATDPLEATNHYAPGHAEFERLWPLLEPYAQQAADILGYEPSWPVVD